MSRKPWFKAVFTNSVARVVGVFLLISICVIFVLAALGPQIGAPFDNIVMSLNESNPEPDMGSTAVNIEPTQTSVPARTNTSTVTAIKTSTPVVLDTATTQQLIRATPTTEAGQGGDGAFTATPESASTDVQPIVQTATALAEKLNTTPSKTPSDMDGSGSSTDSSGTVVQDIGMSSVLQTATVLAATLNPPTSMPTSDLDITEVFPTSPSSQLPDISLPEPTYVAFSNVSIVDVSGGVIGDGTLKVYYPQRLDYPNSARVELELNFDNKYITPTPFGQVTSVAVTQVTSTPRAGQPTPTEREPAYAVSGVQFNQLMGASLICLDTQFDGCDDEPNPDDVQLITLAGRTWTWTIKPFEDVSGYQDLSIQLWKVQQVNGRDVTETLWNYGFKLLVNEAPASIPVLWLIIGGGALGVGSIFIYAAWLNWRKRVQASKPRPKAFVSYRRSTSWAAARTIHDRLTEYGADVFIDVEGINDGRFAGVITNAIESCDFFILVLAPGSLDSDWVIKEAQHALQHDKRIIPVLVDGFDLYSGDLPEELKDITAHNAIKLTPEFFNAGIDRIAKFMNLIIP